MDRWRGSWAGSTLHSGPEGPTTPLESLGLAGYADCLAGFIERLGLGRPNVAGLSFGGILALELPPASRAGWSWCPPMPAGGLAARRGRRPAPMPGLHPGRPIGEDLHASIPGSRLVVLPDAGHVCNIEVPEDFNDALRGFFRD